MVSITFLPSMPSHQVFNLGVGKFLKSFFFFKLTVLFIHIYIITKFFEEYIY